MRTALYELHRQRGAKLVDFAGFEMPLDYGSSLAEHRAVREAAGLFDVSHMGVVHVSGEDALAWLDGLLTNRLEGLEPGRILYSPLCAPDGGTIDDLLIYVLDAARFMLVVNAANHAKDVAHLRAALAGAVELRDAEQETGILALQGPRAEAILRRLVGDDAPLPRFYRFVAELELAGQPCLVSRTGYTGEDGFEFYMPSARAEAVYEALMAAGEEEGLVPAGLAARDSLRLEAALPLYGHEISETLTPLDGGLGRFVKLDGQDFVGRDALLAQRDEGRVRGQLALVGRARGLARAGDQVLHEGEAIGYVTSGAFSPTLETGIALASVEPGIALAAGSEVEVRGARRGLAHEVVDKPFYRRG